MLTTLNVDAILESVFILDVHIQSGSAPGQTLYGKIRNFLFFLMLSDLCLFPSDFSSGEVRGRFQWNIEEMAFWAPFFFLLLVGVAVDSTAAELGAHRWGAASGAKFSAGSWVAVEAELTCWGWEAAGCSSISCSGALASSSARRASSSARRSSSATVRRMQSGCPCQCPCCLHTMQTTGLLHSYR